MIDDAYQESAFPAVPIHNWSSLCGDRPSQPDKNFAQIALLLNFVEHEIGNHPMTTAVIRMFLVVNNEMTGRQPFKRGERLVVRITLSKKNLVFGQRVSQ